MFYARKCIKNNIFFIFLKLFLTSTRKNLNKILFKKNIFKRLEEKGSWKMIVLGYIIEANYGHDS